MTELGEPEPWKRLVGCNAESFGADKLAEPSDWPAGRRLDAARWLGGFTSLEAYQGISGIAVVAFPKCRECSRTS